MTTEAGPLALTHRQILTVLTGVMAGMLLPLRLQAVKGMSPTESGLALLPAVVGIFATPAAP